MLKLNLGCGVDIRSGYVNVDRHTISPEQTTHLRGNPDVIHNLEKFPWPWETSSVDEIVMHHVLEHLGETTDVFFDVIKELYRICIGGAKIHISVPHPRHNVFIGDPSHVRIITPEVLKLFSQKENEKNISVNSASSLLGLYLNVNFEIIEQDMVVDPMWSEFFVKRNGSRQDIEAAAFRYNNVIREILMVWEVIK